MASEPRTIKGPCFDECERGIHWNRTQGTHKWCGCQTRGKTEPHEKIEPEQRPNVPQGMILCLAHAPRRSARAGEW